MPRYKDVDVDHPSIINTIKRMAADGKKTEEIMRVVGMPAEVIRKHTDQGEVKRGPGRPPKNR